MKHLGFEAIGENIIDKGYEENKESISNDSETLNEEDNKDKSNKSGYDTACALLRWDASTITPNIYIKDGKIKLTGKSRCATKAYLKSKSGGGRYLSTTGITYNVPVGEYILYANGSTYGCGYCKVCVRYKL